MEPIKLDIPAAARPALKLATFAASTNKALPILCAVRIDATGGVLRVTATNSYVATRAGVKVDNLADVAPVLVPAEIVKRALKLFPKRGGGITMTAEGSRVTFSNGYETAGGELYVDAEYPAIDGLIDAARDGAAASTAKTPAIGLSDHVLTFSAKVAKVLGGYVALRVQDDAALKAVYLAPTDSKKAGPAGSLDLLDLIAMPSRMAD